MSRPSSTRLRRQTFDAYKYQCPLSKRWLMDCYLCGFPIDVVKDGPDSWEAEHVKRRALADGNAEMLAEIDSVENVKPAHAECHKPKTAIDVRDNAKGKRVSGKHFNVERRRKKPWKPSGMKYNWRNGRYEKQCVGE